LPTPLAFDAAVTGFPSDYCHNVSYEKPVMVWLPDLLVSTEYMNVTDEQTDR